jgi:hypothetical protein
MICPKCKMENQSSAKLCRMCAAPLTGIGGIDMNPYNSPGATGQAKPTVPGPGEILCPTCKAINDATWAYCQQCGSQLHKAKVAPPPAMVVTPALPANPQPAAANRIPLPSPIPNRLSPLTPPPPPPPPPAGSTAGPRTLGGGPATAAETINGVTCNSCGRSNASGSSFCATCGAALTIDTSRAVTPRLRLIQEGGGDGEVYKVDSDEIVIGRNNGDIRFPHDGYMSGRHARVVRRGEKFVLVDENSRNGTFKRIDGEVELKTGDIILIGKQLFRFEV